MWSVTQIRGTQRQVASPWGPIVLAADAAGLTALLLPNADGSPAVTEGSVPAGPAAVAVLDQAERELAEYFAGARREFDVTVAPVGTAFRQEVWAALQTIPFGDVWSYAKLAAVVGRPKGPRAVGQANGQNPVAIIIPCHRVIAADGTLGGYGGGLDRKAWLLAHEGVTLVG